MEESTLTTNHMNSPNRKNVGSPNRKNDSPNRKNIDSPNRKNGLHTRLRVHENHIKVVCRVRPSRTHETGGFNLFPKKCITIQENSQSLVLHSSRNNDVKIFHFDYVANELMTQNDMFELVGQPITHVCLEGFNGTIICYGQTGSGKSHTIFGTIDGGEKGEGSEGRGLGKNTHYIY